MLWVDNVLVGSVLVDNVLEDSVLVDSALVDSELVDNAPVDNFLEDNVLVEMHPALVNVHWESELLAEHGDRDVGVDIQEDIVDCTLDADSWDHLDSGVHKLFQCPGKFGRETFDALQTFLVYSNTELKLLIFDKVDIIFMNRTDCLIISRTDY